MRVKYKVRFILKVREGWFYNGFDFLQELAELNQTFRAERLHFPDLEIS
jgi:hypothetical protein